MSQTTITPGGTPINPAALVRVDGTTITGDGANTPLSAVGAGGVVHVDDVTIGGNGLGPTTALHTITGGVAVIPDGTTITGNGTTGNPLVATGGGGGGTVHVDGTSIAGTGATGSPLHTVGGGTAVVADGETIVGNGTTASPLSAVGGGGGGAVITNSTLSGTGLSGHPLMVVNAPLSVVSFGGAVPDGTVDATAAIQATIAAAIAAGVNVYFPPGRYLVTAPGVNIPACSGLTLISNPGQAVIVYSSLSVGGSVALTINNTGPGGSGNVDTGVSFFNVYGLSFEGSVGHDEKFDNVFVAIGVDPGVTDCLFTRSVYTYTGGPLGCDDSVTSARINFYQNYVHNNPGSVTVASFSTIEDNDFIMDTAIPSSPTGRGHPIYEFGSFQNVSIINNRVVNASEEDIQIRASTALFNQKNQYLISGNYFENSQQTSIWVGGDASTDIGTVQIIGNRFKNANGPVFATGVRGAVIADNIVEYNWQLAQQCGPAISLSAGAGVGHYGYSNGNLVANNVVTVAQPFCGIMTIVSQPHDGDTVTIGQFTYTWRTVPTVQFDVLIDDQGRLRADAENFYTTVIAEDSAGPGGTQLTFVMNNVLRQPIDCFTNFNEVGPNNVVGVASWATFAWSTASGGRITLGGVVDFVQLAGAGFQVSSSVCPVLIGNVCNDTYGGYLLDHNYQMRFIDNTYNVGSTSQAMIGATANVLSYYRGINVITQFENGGSRPFQWMVCTDAFPIIEDGILLSQQGLPASQGGRAGVITIGTGQASTFLYYGSEIIDTDGGVDGDSATLLFRWNDGDQVILSTADSSDVLTCTFQRQTPGAGQFNSNDTLLALINADAVFGALYEPCVDDLGAGQPHLLIRIFVKTAGVAGNGAVVFVRRYANPAVPGGTWAVTAQPLTVGLILRNTQNAEPYATLAGGCATPVTKTYVMSRCTNPDRGVFVQGVDAASNGLHPVVYQADMIAGVGFVITHDADTTSGAAQFLFRCN